MKLIAALYIGSLKNLFKGNHCSEFGCVNAIKSSGNGCVARRRMAI